MFTDKYEVSNYEFGKTLNKKIMGTTILRAKIGIPKLMTNMTMSEFDSKKNINKNLFINAPDCKISVPNTITTRGYCTIEKYKTEVINFSNKVKIDDNGNKYIDKGTPVMIEVLYNDVLNMHITGKE